MSAVSSKMLLKKNLKKALCFLTTNPPATDIITSLYIFCQDFFSGLIGTSILRMKAAAFGVPVGKGVVCYGSIHIMRAPGSKIVIGNNVSIVSSSARCTAASIYAPTKLRTWSAMASIHIEDNVGLNGTSISARSKTVRIGSGTMIAPNCVITDSDYHAPWPPENRLRNPAFENDADVVIGKNVWIGMQTIILKGAQIGDNTIIGSGSVVTGDIPANVLAAGVPARVIKTLP